MVRHTEAGYFPPTMSPFPTLRGGPSGDRGDDSVPPGGPGFGSSSKSRHFPSMSSARSALSAMTMYSSESLKSICASMQNGSMAAVSEEAGAMFLKYSVGGFLSQQRFCELGQEFLGHAVADRTEGGVGTSANGVGRCRSCTAIFSKYDVFVQENGMLQKQFLHFLSGHEERRGSLLMSSCPPIQSSSMAAVKEEAPPASSCPSMQNSSLAAVNEGAPPMFLKYSVDDFLSQQRFCELRQESLRHVVADRTEGGVGTSADGVGRCRSCLAIFSEYDVVQEKGMLVEDFLHFLSRHQENRGRWSKTFVVSLAFEKLPNVYHSAPGIVLSLLGSRAPKRWEGKSDPYLKVLCRADGGGWETVFITEPKMDNDNPLFEKMNVTLNGADEQALEEAPFRIEVWDWNKKNDVLMGHLELSVYDVRQLWLQRASVDNSLGRRQVCGDSESEFLGFMKVLEFGESTPARIQSPT